jgi:apolipoprotein N-acyltransferase
VNVILFLGFCHSQQKHLAKAIAWATAVVLLMLTISLCMLPYGLDVALPKTEVVVVQPNIDPYTQKFEGTTNFIPFPQQVQRMMRLSDSLITPKTRWVLWPETSLDVNLDEDGLKGDALIQMLQRWVDERKGLNLIVGITTYIIYNTGQEPSGARFKQGIGYYDVFNTALHIQAGGQTIGVYHKSKLVPGVEALPYPALLGPLTALTIDLGGTSGGLARQPNREVFRSQDSSQAIGPAICYESVFGDFMADFSREGGQAIGIITNDAWWGRTPGHEQHLLMARLRAIEQRRWVARSANTGISGFIDPIGQLRDTLSYERQGARRATISLSKGNTMYMLGGDLSVLAVVIVFCLWQGVASNKRRANFNTRS